MHTRTHPRPPPTYPPLSPPCRVKEYCINRGFPWVGTVATTVVGEHDYYEELIKFYRANKRV